MRFSIVFPRSRGLSLSGVHWLKPYLLSDTRARIAVHKSCRGGP
jgi:hypothetical protein